MHASCVRSTAAASALTQQTARTSRIGAQKRDPSENKFHWAKVSPSTVPQASSRRASAGSQQQRASPSSGLPAASRHQQQQQSWQHAKGQDQQLRPSKPQPLLPDPEADDLDFLAAAAAVAHPLSPITSLPNTTTPTGVTQAAAAARSLVPTATTGAAGHVPINPITSIPDAGPRYALPEGRTPRYTAADKLQLSGEEMRDIGRRLRRVRSGTQSVLRVFR
jgi:hypothetical protein